MSGDRTPAVSRRTALKLAGGSLATVGGVGTATASAGTTRCDRLDTPQYVVHAVLETEKPATGLRSYISKAVAKLDAELGIEADLRYEIRSASPESLGLTPEQIHPSTDQVAAFDAMRENLPESEFLASVKSGIDEDVTLDDLYFVFVHNNGSLSMSGQWGSSSFAAKRGAAFPGWGQSNPVEHDVVDGKTLDMILFGPTGGLDNAGIAEEVAGYGKWRERVLSY